MNGKDTGLWAVVRRELRRMVQKPIYLFCIVAAPLSCALFFTTLMDDGLPQDMPIGVVDLDNTSTSRNIVRNLDSFQQIEVTARFVDYSEARTALQRGEIYGFFYIPQGTTAKTMRSEAPKISFYTNGSYLVPSSLAYRDMRMMAELASGAAGRTSLYARGATEEQAMGFLQPVKIDMHAVGNPWLNYSVYLSNTLIPAVLMLMVLLVTIYSVHTELKDGTGREWLEIADGNVRKACVGKLLPQMVLFFVMMIFCQIWLYVIMGFPNNGGFLVMALDGLFLIAASQGLALFICELIPSLRWCLSLATLWGVLSFPISGFSFPVSAMPPAMQSMSFLFPLRYYFLVYANQALNGFPIATSLVYFLSMAAFALLPCISFRRLEHTMLNYVYEP